MEAFIDEQNILRFIFDSASNGLKKLTLTLSKNMPINYTYRYDRLADEWAAMQDMLYPGGRDVDIKGSSERRTDSKKN